MTRWVCAVSAIALLATACARRPEPPAEPEEQKPEDIVLRTEADDRRAGEQAAEEVRGAIGVIDDPVLSEYVAALGKRLVRHAPRRNFDYQFRIVDQDAPNAFALPGGFVYVSRGLLVLTNSEDELANVLAHEIAHVAARHAAARQSVATALPGPLRFLDWRGVASYSREQEAEADRLGQGLAGVAGFDPQGMADFLANLEFVERLQLGASRLPTFIDTHPATARRVAEASRRAGSIAWTRGPGIAASRADYLERLEGMIVGGAGAEGVFDGVRFLHPNLGFTLRFPDGWETRNTRQAAGAIAADRSGVIYLEHGGVGTDPEQASLDFFAGEEGRLVRLERRERLQIAGHPAVRAVGITGAPGGGAHVYFTFLVWRGSIYRIVGATRLGAARRFEPLYLSSARTFRPLTGELARSVEEKRLRLVQALGGESLYQLGARTGNAWSAQETAIVNDVFVNEPLRAGQWLKIAVSEQYRPAEGDAVPRPGAAAEG